MTYFGVSAAGWVAWTAIGTLALAAATVVAIMVAQIQAGRDRRRADADRLAEVKRDDDRRAGDRARDDERRAQDRERDERMRREAARELERREAAERRAREDYEARQVLVFVEERAHPSLKEFTHYIIVSAPHAYPIKQVQAALGGWRQSSFGTRGLGHAGDEPWPDEQRVYFGFWSHTPERGEYVIIRWVDWHGNRYYQYRHYTERFGQNIDFGDAAIKIDEWTRTGPKPD